MEMGVRKQVEYTCKECGKKFSRYEFDNPPRIFCSRSCSQKYARKRSLRKRELEKQVRCPTCDDRMILIWTSIDETLMGFQCVCQHRMKRPVYLVETKELKL